MAPLLRAAHLIRPVRHGSERSLASKRLNGLLRLGSSLDWATSAITWWPAGPQAFAAGALIAESATVMVATRILLIESLLSLSILDNKGSTNNKHIN